MQWKCSQSFGPSVTTSVALTTDYHVFIYKLLMMMVV